MRYFTGGRMVNGSKGIDKRKGTIPRQFYTTNLTEITRIPHERQQRLRVQTWTSMLAQWNVLYSGFGANSVHCDAYASASNFAGSTLLHLYSQHVNEAAWLRRTVIDFFISNEWPYTRLPILRNDAVMMQSYPTTYNTNLNNTNYNFYSRVN